MRAVKGMSLVECLVALVVLSAGLLGMASLILNGLRTGRGALYRTQAVNLVSDMIERIRANPSAGDAYDCARYLGQPSERGCVSTDSSPGANCSAPELAEDDLARWSSTARTLLPLASGGGCVANVAYFSPGSADEPARYRVSIIWREPGEPAPLSYESDLLLAP